MGKTFGLWNWKGGVTKTTSTLNVASHLVEDHGLRVGTVDFDPQATLTKLAGLAPAELAAEETVLGALLPEEYGELDVREIIRDAPWGGWVLPATPDLAGAELVLNSVPGPHSRLERALRAVRDDVDVILIDGPPRTGKLAFNLLGASDGIFVPVALSYASATSLKPLFQTVRLFSEYEHPVPVLGVFGTLSRNTRHCREVLEGLNEQLGDLMLDATVPNTVSVEDALPEGLAAWQLDRKSLGAKAYTRLTGDLLARTATTVTAAA